MSAKSIMVPSKLPMFCLCCMFLMIILSSLFLLLNPNHLISTPISTASLFHLAFHPSSTSPSTAVLTEKLARHLPSSNSTEYHCLNQSSVSSNESKNNASSGESLCDVNKALLKVFMYELPREFHFGLLHWKQSEVNQTTLWPEVTNDKVSIPTYPGGLNLQHSVEYWLTLDLLSSTSTNVPRPCTAIRVMNSSQADVVFVPFFSSLSYNRCSKKVHHKTDEGCADNILQRKLVRFLEGREEWKRRGGTDHLIVAHHPNSMMKARAKLSPAIFVLADFGRYPADIANIDKDVIAPYKHIIATTPLSESAPFDKRPTLLYFQGAIRRKDGGVIRQRLYNLLKSEPDVHFKFGTARGKGVRNAAQGMATSKFCLNIAGDTPSSNRLFDAIASKCVPVIISDEIELPFEDRLDYTKFCLFVTAKDALKKGRLLNLLRKMNADEWNRMWEGLKRVEKHFEYEYPSRRGDAVEMIWREVWHKVSSRRYAINRKQRFRGSY